MHENELGIAGESEGWVVLEVGEAQWRNRIEGSSGGPRMNGFVLQLFLNWTRAKKEERLFVF